MTKNLILDVYALSVEKYHCSSLSFPFYFGTYKKVNIIYVFYILYLIVFHTSENT